jgi:elongation factor 1-gamma
MPLTLYTTANNYSTYKVRIAAALAGQELKIEEVKTVHTLTPHNKGPVLESEHGVIFGSNAISRHLARLSPASLAYGDSVHASAEVDQWIDYSLNELEPARGVWLFPVLRMMDLNMKAYNGAKKAVSSALKNFNNHLATRTFFVGNAPTIADAAIFSALLDMYSTLFSPNYVKNFHHLNRWFNTLAHHPSFASVVGEVTFATEEKKAPAPPKKQQNQGGGKNKKNKNQNQKQEKKQKPKKDPKPKHWSELLERSEMNLDATKKLFFSKQPFNDQFFDTFWDIYDAKGYSFFRIQYQYNDDNTVYWQTQNQVGMFVQRLDAARKYAMGAMMLNGASEEAGPWMVEGLFLFRGSAIAPEMLDVPDMEYYSKIPVDVSTPEGRDLVKAAWQGEILDGRTVLDRRYFK